MRRYKFPIIGMLLVCGYTASAELKVPHTLLFSPITPEYLQDTAHQWKAIGYDGFLLANIMRNWSDDVWATDGERGTRGDDDQTLLRIKSCNEACRAQGITENFIKVAFYSHVPLWTDDTAWQQINENFREAARFARTSGCRGVALDIEYVGEQYDLDWDGYDYEGYTRDQLRRAAVERGRDLVEAMLQSYPDMVFLTLPEGIYFYGPLATDLLVGVVQGMARADAPGGLHLLTERSYQVVNTLGLIHYAYRLESDILDALDQPTASYWKRRCSIALGGWPLGYYREILDEEGNRLGYSGRAEAFGDRIVGSYADKSGNFSPEGFREQYAGLLLGSKKYCWIYGHGATWWHFTAADVAQYGNVSNSTLPVNRQLDAYKAVVREKWMSSDPMKTLSQRVREYKGEAFLQDLGFVRMFKVIGPFGCRRLGNFSCVFPPEKEIDFDGDYAGSVSPVRWRNVSADAAGYVNLRSHVSPTDWVCAYACCKVISPDSVLGQIRLGTNDTATLWLNGQKMLSKEVERSAVPDSDVIPVHLTKGENTILVKVCNTEYDWGLYLRIADAEGNALTNLTFWP